MPIINSVIVKIVVALICTVGAGVNLWLTHTLLGACLSATAMAAGGTVLLLLFLNRDAGKLVYDWIEIPDAEYNAVYGDPTIDQRDITFSHGLFFKTKAIWDVRVEASDYDLSQERLLRVNRAWIESVLATSSSFKNDMVLEDAYAVDRTANLSNTRRLEVKDETLLMAHVLQDEQTTRRNLRREEAEVYHSISGHHSRLESRRLRKAWSIIRKNRWYKVAIMIWVVALMIMLSTVGYRSYQTAQTYIKNREETKRHKLVGKVYAGEVPDVKRRPVVIRIKPQLGNTTAPSSKIGLVPIPQQARIANTYYDIHDPRNVVAAAHNRLAIQNPLPIVPPRLMAAIDAVINTLIEKFHHDHDGFIFPDIYDPKNAHAWIDSRPYTAARKFMLHNEVLCHFQPDQMGKKVEPHLKSETYANPTKPPRLILAREDQAKIYLGQLFQPLNDWFFHQPFATKHIPEADRPKYITQRLGEDNQYWCTDHSSFECAATPAMMDLIEMKFYKGVLPPTYHYLLDILKEDLRLSHRSGVNITMSSIRCSGEMNTSLGNSLLNYVSLTAVLRDMNIPHVAVVEGDDALISVPPTASHIEFRERMSRLGFRIKIDHYDNVGKAGYCSMKWTSDLQVVPDPKSFLPDYRWADTHTVKRFGEEAIRASKAMSYATSCPYMPVMFKIYERDERSSFRTMLNQYEAEELARVGTVRAGKSWFDVEYTPKARPPTTEERVRFSDLYGVSILTQLSLEAMIDHGEEMFAIENFCQYLGMNLDSVNNFCSNTQ